MPRTGMPDRCRVARRSHDGVPPEMATAVPNWGRVLESEPPLSSASHFPMGGVVLGVAATVDVVLPTSGRQIGPTARVAHRLTIRELHRL